jgi:hypothetical protein
MPAVRYLRATLNIHVMRLAARDVLQGNDPPNLTIPPVSVSQNFVRRL